MDGEYTSGQRNTMESLPVFTVWDILVVSIDSFAILSVDVFGNVKMARVCWYAEREVVEREDDGIDTVRPEIGEKGVAIWTADHRRTNRNSNMLLLIAPDNMFWVTTRSSRYLQFSALVLGVIFLVKS